MKPRKYTDAEFERIVAAYRRSTKSQSAFCAEQGIKKSTLHYFLYFRGKKRKASTKKPAFVEISRPSAEAMGCRLVLPGGMELVTSSLPPTSYLAELSGALS